MKIKGELDERKVHGPNVSQYRCLMKKIKGN